MQHIDFQRFRPAIALCLAIGAVVAAGHLIDTSGSSRSLYEFRNSLHAPAFAVLVVIIFLILRRGAGSRVAFASAAVGALLTAVAGELLQEFGAGEASAADLVHDAIGISGTLLLIAFADKRLHFGSGHFVRAVILAVGTAICAATLFPGLSYAYAYAARAQAMPHLISFDHDWEKVFYHGYGKASVDPIASHSDIDRAAVVSLGRARYSGLAIEPYPDWRSYSALRFSVSSIGQLQRRLTLRINDANHNQHYRDRFNRTFEIGETATTITIPLSEISALANGRQMQLDSIRSMVFFVVDPDGTERIIIGDIRLE